MSKLFTLHKKGLWTSCIVLSLFVFSFSSLILKKEGTLIEENRITLDSFPESFGDWTAGEELGIDIRSLDVLRLSSYVKRVYTNSKGNRIFLYIGYWASQTGEHQAAKHSPMLCLPSNGWLTSNRKNHDFSFKDLHNQQITIPMRRILGEKRGTTTMFYYWFFTGSEYYNQEWYALVKLSLQNLLYGRNDGGIVEIAADLSRTRSKTEAEEEANSIIQDFMNHLAPYLHKEITQSNVLD
jgi:EpsI family protein